jgi:energy-coupling factor transporter transmembrane protein EcfT
VSPNPETRAQRLSHGIHGLIAAAAFAGGIAAAVYFRDVVAIALIGCGVFVALALAYTILALLFVWPKLRWREFLSEVIDFLAF